MAMLFSLMTSRTFVLVVFHVLAFIVGLLVEHFLLGSRLVVVVRWRGNI
jgi:hypothetical protein